MYDLLHSCAFGSIFAFCNFIRSDVLPVLFSIAQRLCSIAASRLAEKLVH